MSGENVQTNYQDGVTITPSDTAPYQPPLRGVYVGGYVTGTTVGDVAITTPAGTVLTFKNVAPGTIIPVAASKVMAANTTATLLVGLK